MCPNMYLSLQDYIRFGGNVSIHAEEYSRIEYDARRRIDLYTFGRVKHMREVPEAVKRLMFELIHPQATSAATANSTAPVASFSTALVASFSTDGYSETYVNTHTSEYLRYSGQKEKALIYEYLAGVTDDNGVALLYSGGA